MRFSLDRSYAEMEWSIIALVWIGRLGRQLKTYSDGHTHEIAPAGSIWHHGHVLVRQRSLALRWVATDQNLVRWVLCREGMEQGCAEQRKGTMEETVEDLTGRRV